jgi:hypothetical protein
MCQEAQKQQVREGFSGLFYLLFLAFLFPIRMKTTG